MDYIITFSDNSSAFLAHYGVKGMKWGEWNSETKARYAGAGNGTFYKKASKGTEYSKSVTDLRRAYNANQPKSKQIAKNILLTPGGAHAYNTSRSRGLSRTESLGNVPLGLVYAQGVKYKQKKLGTTKPKVSGAAKERSEYQKNESFKKSLAKTLLVSGTSAGANAAYNTVKARTKSRGKAVLAVVGVGAGSYLLGNLANPIALGVAKYTGNEKNSKQTDALKFKTRTPETKRNGKQRW